MPEMELQAIVVSQVTYSCDAGGVDETGRDEVIQI